MRIWIIAALAARAAALHAEDDFTLYELLAHETHKFAITYDVATSVAGSPFYLNPIRRGSKASDERVIDLATGKDLKFETIDGKTAKATGLRTGNTPDDSHFLKVQLASPVPKNGQARIRIIKTYEDALSYYGDAKQIVFDRGLGIRRNVVVLPAGYELIGCSVPAIVSSQPDGRVRISMLNDRDDELPVKITGRRLR
jgi:hypothetical protein